MTKGMTREEAIQELLYLCDEMPSMECWDWKMALDMAIKALEQESKSEWEHDHEILKAYSDGASDVLDKIRAEIKHFMFDVNANSSESDYACNYILSVLDKYKAESEE